MSPPYLVTGAAGFIGSHSVDQLLAAGRRVIGVDNLRSGHLANLAAAFTSPGFEFIEADAGDETTMRSLFQRSRPGGVLHLAALVSVPESFKDPAYNYHANLAAGDLLARLCVEYGGVRIVFASSAAVYGDTSDLPCRESSPTRPLSPYAAAKLAAEVMLLGYAASYGLPAVCLRYFNVYGPRQDPRSPYSGVLSIFTQRFRAGLPITVYGDGEQTRDFISVRDVAAINIRALLTDGIASDRYNVCTGVATSLNRVIALCRSRFPEAPPVQYAAARQGDIRHSYGDPTRLCNVFALDAHLSFAHGLDELLGAPSER